MPKKKNPIANLKTRLVRKAQAKAAKLQWRQQKREAAAAAKRKKKAVPVVEEMPDLSVELDCEPVEVEEAVPEVSA